VSHPLLSDCGSDEGSTAATALTDDAISTAEDTPAPTPSAGVPATSPAVSHPLASVATDESSAVLQGSTVTVNDKADGDGKATAESQPLATAEAPAASAPPQVPLLPLGFMEQADLTPLAANLPKEEPLAPPAAEAAAPPSPAPSEQGSVATPQASPAPLDKEKGVHPCPPLTTLPATHAK